MNELEGEILEERTKKRQYQLDKGGPNQLARRTTITNGDENWYNKIMNVQQWDKKNAWNVDLKRRTRTRKITRISE